MKPIVIILFVTLFSQVQAFAQEKKHRSFKDWGINPDQVWAGPRINYMQGKDGFAGLAFHLNWHEVEEIIPFRHVGFAVGSDFKLSPSFLMAPKVTVEYRFLIGIIRTGYSCYTDFGRSVDHRISAEIGLSLFSFADLTYVHTFGFNNNPFNLGNDYVNFTVTIPLKNDYF